MRRINSITGLIALILLLGASVSSAEVKDFDHSYKLYAGVLAQFVKDGLVDYSALKSNPKELKSYLGRVAAVSEADFSVWTRNQKLAFLINLYNAETLNLIIDHYPVGSIKDIAAHSKGPWELPAVPLFDEKITLNQLEHEVIRRNYAEPRVHFALVCAALGCPALRNEPYFGDRLDRQLEEQGRQFMADSGKNYVDVEKRIVYLSPIFQWFPEDFIANSGSVLLFVEQYFPDKVSGKLADGDFEIQYTHYEWSLNDSASKQG